MANIPIDNPQDRARAGKEPDTSSQATYNQRQNENEGSNESIARSGNAEVEYQGETLDKGREGRTQDEGRMKNETSVRRPGEVRESHDKGYGSQHRGDEYNDVKIEKQEDEAA